jgi:hypothetical protein
MKCFCGRRITLAEEALGCKPCGAMLCAMHRPTHTCPQSIAEDKKKQAARDTKTRDVPVATHGLEKL